jgi:phage terminase small subunit
MEQIQNIRKAALPRVEGDGRRERKKARTQRRRSPMTFYKRKRPLSPRQQKFVEHYLINGIGRQAALHAGYSPASAGNAAWRLQRLPNVAKAIRLGRSSEARRAQVERDRVLLELVRVAFSDIGEVLDWTSGDDITLRPKAAISPHHRAAIAELAPGRMGKAPRVRLHSKAHALDAIARHLRLFDKQPPTINLQAQRRDGRDARTILLERFARLSADTRKKKEEAERAEASLNAGAPLGIPAAEAAPRAADSSLPSPHSEVALRTADSSLPSPPSSFSPSPRDSGEREGPAEGGRVRGAADSISTAESPSPGCTFPAGFVLSRK